MQGLAEEASDAVAVAIDADNNVGVSADMIIFVADATLAEFGSIGVFVAVIHEVLVDDWLSVGIFFAFFMLAAFMGIAYWDRPTFIPTSDYSADQIAAMNTKYQDYIASFENGEGGKILPNPNSVAHHRVRTGGQASRSSNDDKDLSRLESYLVDAETVIKRMHDITKAMEAFGTLPSNISESERETRSNQALAINNNAVALNKKVLGLFHPHESSDAHKELIQASECVRLAAYALYSYTLQENPEQQLIQYKQSRDQIGQMKIYLRRFWNATEALQSNNQQPTEQ